MISSGSREDSGLDPTRVVARCRVALVLLVDLMHYFRGLILSPFLFLICFVFHALL